MLYWNVLKAVSNMLCFQCSHANLLSNSIFKFMYIFDFQKHRTQYEISLVYLHSALGSDDGPRIPTSGQETASRWLETFPDFSRSRTL